MMEKQTEDSIRCNRICTIWGMDHKIPYDIHPTIIPVLHTTPTKYATNILENGFETPAQHLDRISFGRGSGEDDILFFERDTVLGREYIQAWTRNLQYNRKDALPHTILQGDLCSCHHLSKSDFKIHREKLARNAATFIVKSLEEPDINHRLFDHFYGRLASDSNYDDPFSFLRKTANDATHMKVVMVNGKEQKQLVDINIGAVIQALGYDTADGYEGSHMFDPKHRYDPINEVISAVPQNVWNIRRSADNH